MKKVILSIIFILGLVYILSPGPDSISDFSPIPNSLKSDEPGDTTQVPNVAAYFSDFERRDITNFYRQELRDNYFFGKLLPPVSLNYPPRASWQYVRDLQTSTFLEEYTYPLREPIFVNGYEPYVENEMRKGPHSFLGDRIHIDGKFFKSKTTIRLYPNSWYVRLLVYLGIWGAALALWWATKQIFAKER